jgi:hypothetical protein
VESLVIPIIWSGDIFPTWEYTGKLRQENSGHGRYFFLEGFGLAEGAMRVAATIPDFPNNPSVVRNSSSESYVQKRKPN